MHYCNCQNIPDNCQIYNTYNSEYVVRIIKIYLVVAAVQVHKNAFFISVLTDLTTKILLIGVSILFLSFDRCNVQYHFCS